MANRDGKLIERTLKDFSLNISTDGGNETPSGGSGTSQDLLYFFSWYPEKEKELEAFEELHKDDPVEPGMVRVFGLRLKSIKALKDFFVKYGFDLRIRIAGYRDYSQFYVGTFFNSTEEAGKSSSTPISYLKFYFNLNDYGNPVYHAEFLGSDLDVSNYNWGGSGSNVSLEMFIDRMADQLLSISLTPGNSLVVFPRMFNISFIHEPLIQCGQYEWQRNEIIVGSQDESDRTPIVGARIVQYQLKDFFDLFECQTWEVPHTDPK